MPSRRPAQAGRQPADRSAELFSEAVRLIPGGVNSPVRAFSAVGGSPRFISSGYGSQLRDADGNQYIDYVMSWGPLIHGHAFPPVVEAVKRAASEGTSFGAPTEGELRLAELVTATMRSVEMVRFVNSGTEATMSALRLARATTGRDLIVKFAGNYHGHTDSLLAEAGSGSLTLGVPSTPGVPAAVTGDTLIARYNDVESVDRLFGERAGEIAAVIVEPIAANMGVVPPAEGFLQHVRKVTSDSGSLLIFDEVITGFRVAPGGAQELFGIEPDLTTLGKVVGGGLPVGAYGGRREIMEQMAPTGPVYQAGTLSGNPLAMAAGIATIEGLKGGDTYEHLAAKTSRLAAGLEKAARIAGTPATINAVTGMLTVFFSEDPVTDLETAKVSDTARFARFFHEMLERGVYMPPSQFEAWMLSLAHSEDDIVKTVEAALESFRAAG
ncbi:MAG TPA: glutamate-1-semialdehyde 2,1-aminomutase [Dehalococcoidia bacterium]